MRISANKTDPDFYPCLFVGPMGVNLDGVELKHVLEADDVAGYVIHHHVEASGKLARNYPAGELLRVRSEGRVELIGERRAQRLVNAN